MKLLIDARFTTFPQHNGISRFGANLIAAAAKTADVEMLVCDDRQLPMLPDVPFTKINNPLSILEPFIARRINQLRPDVVFSPMQVMGRWGRDYGLIVTVHDLIYYQHRMPPPSLPGPTRLAWRLFHNVWWPQRLLLNTADAVAAVSLTTASLIRERSLTRRPVELVTNAPPSSSYEDDGLPETEKALIYMGSFMPYKNVETLIQGMKDLQDYTLHLLSPIDPGRRRQLEAVIPAGATVKFHNGVTDEGYGRLLKRAAALVTLSRMEGYGLPIVEAMAAGTPVIASNIPIFREVGGDAIAFIPPENPERLAMEVRRLEQRDARTRAVLAGKRQAAKYNWERSAAQLLAMATQVHNERQRENTRSKFR